MTWMDHLNSLIRHFLAIQLRHKVRRHTVATLSCLDDRMLADIGVPRHRIAEYAREAAHISIPATPMPAFARKSILQRLRSWRQRRVAIRELSALDDRLLRDIGIERGQIGDVVDAVLSRRHDLGTAHPVIQLTDAMQRIFVPAAQRASVPATSVSSSRTLAESGNRALIAAERTPDACALQRQAANESQPTGRRRRVAAGM